MATTTTNYGFDIPQSTDLVKDGATAIATLGQDIDTAMNTALGTKKAGMVLLNTTSFSGVASQSVSDVFSATYDNYLIVVNSKSDASAGDVLFRLRASGSDNSSAVYGNAVRYASSGSGTGFIATGATNTSATIGYLTAALYSSQYVQINRPFETIPTNWSSEQMRTESAANGTTEYRYGGHSHGANYSATGFTIIFSNNATGKVMTYGRNF
jgi:hypothetical protein